MLRWEVIRCGRSTFVPATLGKDGFPAASGARSKKKISGPIGHRDGDGFDREGQGDLGQ